MDISPLPNLSIVPLPSRHRCEQAEIASNLVLNQLDPFASPGATYTPPASSERYKRMVDEHDPSAAQHQSRL